MGTNNCNEYGDDDHYDDDNDDYDNDDYDDHDYDDHDDCFRLSKLMVSNHYDAIYKCKTSNQWYQYKNKVGNPLVTNRYVF